jgi:hypothetical protein
MYRRLVTGTEIVFGSRDKAAFEALQKDGAWSLPAQRTWSTNHHKCAGTSEFIIRAFLIIVL